MWPGGCLMETMENHGMDAEFNFESALEDYLSTDFGDLEEGTIVKGEKIGRNDPCPCGSGKKYKKCCGANL